MPGIDGLRAIAVAAVIGYHADASWMPGGFLGVDVFFVISGYLITSLLLTESEAAGRIALRAFWVRRARRLLPAVFLLLAVCLLAGDTLARGRLDLRGDALAALFYVANWRFIFDHASYFDQFGRPPLLRHLWSLAVEEQFYLLWPPLLVLGLRLRRRGMVPLLVAIAALGSTALMWVLYAPGTDTSRVYYGTDTHAAPILVGVFLAFVWRPGRLPSLPRPALDLVSVAALAAVVYAFVGVHDDQASLYRGGLLVLALCSAVLLATVVHPAGTVGRVLARPVPRWLGERSYGIYLWHWPVLVLTRPGVDVQLPRVPLFLLQVGITLLLAAVSYRFVERPIRNGALSRLRVRIPRLAAQPRTPIALAGLALAALSGLAVLTPQSVQALPPGFTASTLADSQRSSMTLVQLPNRVTRKATTAPARLASPLATHGTRPPSIPRRGPILAVGDSVMLGASSALTAALGAKLHIDAVVSRQADETIDRLLAIAPPARCRSA